MKYASQLERGRRAYERCAWTEAVEVLTAADEVSPLEVQDLESLAWAGQFAGRTEPALAVFERAYQAWLDAGLSLRAARAAFWIGFRLAALGQFGRANGWLTRAQRLVDDAPAECAERGLLLLAVAMKFQRAGAHQEMLETAERISAIGDQHGDLDLSTFGRNLQGRALLRLGQVARGMALLDESMLALTAGKISHVLMGLVYCGMIASCQRVWALDRAREWTRALSDWCEAQQGLAGFHGACLVHRAEFLQMGGDWPECLEEAKRAHALVGDADPGTVASAYYQEGEIYRLRGDETAAEKCFATARERGGVPQPGLALLRLGQGHVDAAKAAITCALAESEDPLLRARLLPAALEIHVAAGDLAAAREACEELEKIAHTFDTEALVAFATHGRGLLRLAEGDAQAALGPLRRAFWLWQRLGAPYVAARVRVDLGRACQALGDREGAELERTAAKATFEELAAAPDLAALAGTSLARSTKPPRGLTVRELEVLRLVAAGKTNKAMARELFLSEKTVDRHLSNIFVKLDVGSRAAATAFAYENGLIASS